jgi:hypothetical protein
LVRFRTNLRRPVRFEWDSLDELKKDWPEALEATSRWREQRREKATGIHLFFQASAERIWQGVDFVKSQAVVPPHELPVELRGLALIVYVVTSDGEHYLYAEMYPWSTTPVK